MAQNIQPPQLQRPIGQTRRPPNQHRGRPDDHDQDDMPGGTGDVYGMIWFIQLLQQIVQSTQGMVSGGVTTLQLGPLNINIGTGSPAGIVSGSPPDIYLDSNGGAATLWIKQTGAGTTAGWVSK